MSRGKKTAYNIITVLAVIAIILAAVFAVFMVKNHKKYSEKKANGTVSTVSQETVSSVPEKTESIPPVNSEPEKEEETSSSDTVTVTDYTAKMYTTSKDLNVRSEPNSNNKPLGALPFGAEVSVTGKCANGWYRIDYKGQTAYCYGGYLSDKKPDTTPKTVKQSNSAYHIAVNRAQNMVVIYKKDDKGEYTVPVKAMTCSVGRKGHETPRGDYTLSDKYKWACLSGGVWGQYVTRITGPYLFHSVPYFTQNKSNLEYEEYNKLGQPASKGCVRLSVADAKWIFENCAKGTTVKIYDSSETEPLAKPTPIKIDPNDSKKGWDPTDPDPKNPWKK